jgi:hypothetical protein
MLGTACITAEGNRNLADFFEVAIDNQGRARIVYTDTSNNLSGPTGAVPAADHSGAALVTTVTQQTGLNAWTGKPLKAAESRAPRLQITDPSGDARYPVLGGAEVPGADIERVMLERDKNTLDILVWTRHGTLADAATAAAAPYGRLVVRWQMGNTLYHAGIDQAANGGAPTFYAGKTQSTDSCSVSACDPHTLDYVAPPLAGSVSVAHRMKVGQSTIYKLRIPVSAIGNPSWHKQFESVAAYTFAAAVPGSVQDSKAQSDVDQVPLELDGTKSFNFRADIEHNSNPDSGVFGGFAFALPLAALAPLTRRLRRRRR